MVIGTDVHLIDLLASINRTIVSKTQNSVTIQGRINISA